MKKKLYWQFVLMSIADYSLILLSVLGYRLSGGLSILLLAAILGLSFANAKVARKAYQFIILSIHLLIATLIASPLGVLLHYYNDGDLPETLQLIAIFAALDCAGAIGFSLLAFFVYKKRWKSDNAVEKYTAKPIWIISIAVWSLVIILTAVIATPRELHITDTQNTTITYRYDGTEINEPLSTEDALKIAELYDGKAMSLFTESCAFRDDIAICFGNQKLRIATDGSGTILYNGRFINIAGEQRARLRNILFQYGAEFPCIEYRTLF